MFEIGIASLTEHVRTTADGRTVTAEERMLGLIDLAVLADSLGFDAFSVGEHHSPDFVVSSPAVLLAAIAARTQRIRLGSAVTVLSALDPVRVYEDFSALDLVSAGRAEIIVGRGAFAEPFDIFGVSMQDYDAAFDEKLDLLLQLNRAEKLTWTGRFRTALKGAEIAPRPVQNELPVWIGIGGTPASAERAGRLGLPMTIGSLGMAMHQIKHLAETYRAAGEAHPHRLRLGFGAHLHVVQSAAGARAVFPYYRAFLGPKRIGGQGMQVTQHFFDAGFHPQSTRYIGTAAEVEDKLLALHQLIRFDRFQGVVGWGGLSPEATEASLRRFTEEVAPSLRAAADIV